LKQHYWPRTLSEPQPLAMLMHLTVNDTFGRQHDIFTSDSDNSYTQPRWFLQEDGRELVRIGDDVFMVIDQPNAAPLRVVHHPADTPASA
jgi:hypothetical protein